jgi:uncharacterized damage-inducible protein DinB
MELTVDFYNYTKTGKRMNRRKSIGLLGMGSLLLAQNAFPRASSVAGYTASDDNFMKAFSARWEGLRVHTFEVYEAMPDAQFGFQPTEDVMSFAKLFSHIGVSLDYYAEILDGTLHKEEIESVEKGVVLTYLQGRFERFEAAFNQLNPTDLYNPKHISRTIDGEIESSDYDILMLAYNHTVHHKGQATTYLRLKDIVPPQYRF